MSYKTTITNEAPAVFAIIKSESLIYSAIIKVQYPPPFPAPSKL